jgi:hypothetical protein
MVGTNTILTHHNARYDSVGMGQFHVGSKSVGARRWTDFRESHVCSNGIKSLAGTNSFLIPEMGRVFADAN